MSSSTTPKWLRSWHVPGYRDAHGMNIPRLLLFGGVGLVLLAVLAFFARNAGRPRPTSSSPVPTVAVAASFYPLAEFARAVGGELVTVTQITPAGVDAHDFQLSPQHLLTIRAAKLFLYNGGGIEPWAERIHDDTARQGVRVINMVEALGLQARSAAEEPEHVEEEHADEEENAHETLPGGTNPHIWVDPNLAKRQVEIIRAAFAEVDPAHAVAYRENAERSVKELDALDAAFRTGLASCTHRTVIISHDALRRLVERYGLDFVPLAGLAPEEGTRPQQLAAVYQRARQENIRTVFSEVLVRSRAIETFAREIGAEVRPLHPLEGLTAAEQAAGKTFVSVMRENLDALRSGLDCR